jgi:hypothetical protein
MCKVLSLIAHFNLSSIFLHHDRRFFVSSGMNEVLAPIYYVFFTDKSAVCEYIDGTAAQIHFSCLIYFSYIAFDTVSQV